MHENWKKNRVTCSRQNNGRIAVFTEIDARGRRRTLDIAKTECTHRERYDSASISYDCSVKECCGCNIVAAGLPNATRVHSSLGLAFAAAEGGAKLRHVRDRVVDAIFRIRGRIRQHGQPHQLRTIFRTPAKGKSKKETLSRS